MTGTRVTGDEGRREAPQPARPRDAREHARGRAEVAGLRRAGLGVGQPHRQGDRRDLGRGAVPVRRYRRVLGRGAASHRRAARRDVLHSLGAQNRMRRCGSASAPSSTPSTAAWHRRIRARSRICARRCRATPKSSNASIRAPRPSCSPGARAGLRPARHAFADLDVDPDRVREVAALIPGAMRGLVSERQLGSYADLEWRDAV